jgi:undecaprenyl phosphate-alpha-L-ara4N flippase subunit ArnE
MIKIAAIILILISCLLAAGGSLFLKKASGNIKFDKIRSLLNQNLILGIALYIISGAMVVALLKFNDLSFIYPLTALTYVFVAVISWKYLNEKINIYKITAISLIVIGVALVAMS